MYKPHAKSPAPLPVPACSPGKSVRQQTVTRRRRPSSSTRATKRAPEVVRAQTTRAPSRERRWRQKHRTSAQARARPDQLMGLRNGAHPRRARTTRLRRDPTAKQRSPAWPSPRGRPRRGTIKSAPHACSRYDPATRTFERMGCPTSAAPAPRPRPRGDEVDARRARRAGARREEKKPWRTFGEARARGRARSRRGAVRGAPSMCNRLDASFAVARLATTGTATGCPSSQPEERLGGRVRGRIDRSPSCRSVRACHAASCTA